MIVLTLNTAQNGIQCLDCVFETLHFLKQGIIIVPANSHEHQHRHWGKVGRMNARFTDLLVHSEYVLSKLARRACSCSAKHRSRALIGSRDDMCHGQECRALLPAVLNPKSPTRPKQDDVNSNAFQGVAVRPDPNGA